MALIETQPKQLARSGPGYAYPMTGIALGSIFVSGILGGIFTPDMVTGTQHQHFPGAFVGWIFDLIAIGFVVPAAMRGMRAKVTDPAPWTMLGWASVPSGWQSCSWLSSRRFGSPAPTPTRFP